ncbi:hypothetical protein CLI74_08925 [Porphyromonas gingivalis]|nr:hypothetical protein CLI74_08925 [Porphyromonas gingivalis]
MKQKTNRPMAGNKSCREQKSVSSKITIRNSTTLIERSEGHSETHIQEEYLQVVLYQYLQSKR